MNTVRQCGRFAPVKYCEKEPMCLYLRASEASASCGAETGAMGSFALVGTGHAAEVLGAAHGLEVTAYEQQLHLGKGQVTHSPARGLKRPALMLRRFSASAMVA